MRRAIELDEPPLSAADEDLVRNRLAEHERDPSTADKKLERAVEAGFFDAMAAAALREDAEGKTCELDEILGHNGVS